MKFLPEECDQLALNEVGIINHLDQLIIINTARDILFTLPYTSVSRIIQQTKKQNFTNSLE